VEVQEVRWCMNQAEGMTRQQSRLTVDRVV